VTLQDQWKKTALFSRPY